MGKTGRWWALTAGAVVMGGILWGVGLAGHGAEDAEILALRAQVARLDAEVASLRSALGQPAGASGGSLPAGPRVPRSPGEAPFAPGPQPSGEGAPDSRAEGDPPPDASAPPAGDEGAEAAVPEDPWGPVPPSSPVFDIDRDGRVTEDERSRGGELSRRASTFAENRSEDGRFPIPADGFRGGARLFAGMDANDDGLVSEREALTYFVDSIRELRRYDQNQDGALALDEFGHREARFAYLDINDDQIIQAWEINIMRARGKW